MRALFERTISGLNGPDAMHVWETFIEYEAANADLTGLNGACQRFMITFSEGIYFVS